MRRRLILWVALGVVVVAASVVGVLAATREDSGVVACKRMAENANTASTGEGLDAKTYREVRALFAGSRDSAIRSNGTKLIDQVWQASGGSASLPMTEGMVGSYTGLTGACAAHGYTLPPLSSFKRD